MVFPGVAALGFAADPAAAACGRGGALGTRSAPAGFVGKGIGIGRSGDHHHGTELSRGALRFFGALFRARRQGLPVPPRARRLQIQSGGHAIAQVLHQALGDGRDQAPRILL